MCLALCLLMMDDIFGTFFRWLFVKTTSGLDAWKPNQTEYLFDFCLITM